MTNITVFQNAIYAILADSVYWDVKEYNAKIGDKLSPNWTPVPSDWTLIKEVSGSGDEGRIKNPELKGFTPRAYKSDNEIVIAYARTDKKDLSGDLAQDLLLALGLGSMQANQISVFNKQLPTKKTL